MAGHFEIQLADVPQAGFLWVQLLARSAQSGLAWRDVNLNDTSAELNVSLPTASETKGRLIGLEGQPAAGIKLLVERIGQFASGEFKGVDSERAKLPPEVWPTNVVTGADGSYSIPGVPRDADVCLYIAQEPFAPEWSFLLAKDEGAKRMKALSPSQIITGVVVAADTGQPLPHSRIRADQLWKPGKGGSLGVGGQSDAQGRFRLNPFPDTDYAVTAFGPDDSPYLAKKIEFEWPKTAHEHELKIELPRGVLVRGTVVVAEQNRPVGGVTIRFAPRDDNRNTKDIPLGGIFQPTAVSDDNGKFAIAVPAGGGTLTVQAPTGNYVLAEITEHAIAVGKPGGKRLYVNGHVDLNLPKEALEETVSIQLHRGVTIRGEVVGADGRPPDRLLMTYRGALAPHSEEFAHWIPDPLPDNHFEIRGVPPDGEFPVYILDPIRKQGKVLTCRGADAGKDLRVQLEPCGSATMRFVSPDGKPVAGHDPLLMVVFTPGISPIMYYHSMRTEVIADETSISNFDHLNCWDRQCDETGHVQFPSLIPGMTYRLLGSDAQGNFAVEHEFVVKPGEHIDLPDITISDPNVLKAAEENWVKKQKEEAGAKAEGGIRKAEGETQKSESSSSPSPLAGEGWGEGDAAKSEAGTRKSETAAKADDDLVTVRGRVVDAQGKPVAGAGVFATYWHYPTEKNPAPVASAKSDQNGRFELTYSKSEFDKTVRSDGEWQFTTIAAAANEFGPTWVTYYDAQARGEITLKLVPDEPIEGRVVSLEGEPIAGAIVEARGIQTNDEDNLSRWLDGMRAGTNVYHTEGSGTPNRNLNLDIPQLRKRATTDRDGRFRLTGVGSNRQADLTMSGPGVTPTRLRVVARPMEPQVVNIGNDYIPNQPVTYYGSHFQYAAEPSQPVEGIVRDAKSGEPLAGVEIRATQFAGVHFYVGNMLAAISDPQGHYRLDGMPKGEGNRILAVPNDDQPYFLREFNVPSGPELQTVKFDLELHRGTWISGRVTDKSTGKPVHAEMFYVPWPDNPNVTGFTEFRTLVASGRGELPKRTTDQNGIYKIVGAPGRGLVSAYCTERPFLTVQGIRDIADFPSDQKFRSVAMSPPTTTFRYTAVKEVRVEADKADPTLNLQLDPGERLKIHIVDEAGKPLSNVTVNGLAPPGFHVVGRTLGPDAEVEALWPDEKRLLLLHHKERNLGKAICIGVDDAKDGSANVVLEPCAALKGRLLDKDGEPIRGGVVAVWVDDDKRGLQLPEIMTDMQGRFTVTSLLPGMKYNVTIGFDRIVEGLTFAPGETIDFGEINVSSKTRPEPKRMAAKAEGKNAKAEGGIRKAEMEAAAERETVRKP